MEEEIYDGYWVVEWDESRGPVRAVVRVEGGRYREPQMVYQTVEHYRPILLDQFKALGNRFIAPVELWNLTERRRARLKERWRKK
jgi:hypothetical protein